jgi:hypothetical protein
MGHAKRRFNDSLEITRELFQQVNWKNALLSIPLMFFFVPFIWFIMLFEDYDEIDRWDRLMDEELKKLK